MPHALTVQGAVTPGNRHKKYNGLLHLKGSSSVLPSPQVSNKRLMTSYYFRPLDSSYRRLLAGNGLNKVAPTNKIFFV